MSSKSSRPRQSASTPSTRPPTRLVGAKANGAAASSKLAPTTKPSSTASSTAGAAASKAAPSKVSAKLPMMPAQKSVRSTTATAPVKPAGAPIAKSLTAPKVAGSSRTRTGQTTSVRQGRMQRKRRQHAWKQRIPLLSVIGVVVAFVLIVVVLAKVNGSNNTSAFGSVTPAVMSALTGVSPATFSKVGTGVISSSTFFAVSNTPILKDSSGKPIIIYYGGEYCPYCAAERWAIVVAFSRFGTFSNLHFMESSATDNYSNTNTLTFYQSTYTSQYIDFQPVEMYNRTQGTLQKPTAQQQQLLTTYDAAPYVPTTVAGGIPFIDFANQYVSVSSSYLPGILTGLSWQQIAQQISDPNSAIAQSVIGSANYLTAAICKATGAKPASICQTSAIQNILK